jgi:hypothetical protein
VPRIRAGFGLRLYLIATPAGMPILWALADPRLDEREVLAAMVDVEPELAAARPGLLLIADKGVKARWFEADLEHGYPTEEEMAEAAAVVEEEHRLIDEARAAREAERRSRYRVRDKAADTRRTGTAHE